MEYSNLNNVQFIRHKVRDSCHALRLKKRTLAVDVRRQRLEEVVKKLKVFFFMCVCLCVPNSILPSYDFFSSITYHIIHYIVHCIFNLLEPVATKIFTCMH